jgi:hypothetical protein
MKIFKLFLNSIAIFIMASCSFEKSGQTTNDIIVEINFGENKSTIQKKVEWKNGITALEALQHIALVETYPVAHHVFVTSIDSIKGKRGVMAWYYNVNGKPPKVLAINKLIHQGDTILWMYKKDICSATVDNFK